jgi:hypothetical protein
MDDEPRLTSLFWLIGATKEGQSSTASGAIAIRNAILNRVALNDRSATSRLKIPIL